MDFNALMPIIAAGLVFLAILLIGVGVMGYLSSASDTARLKERVTGASVDRKQGLVAPFMGLWRSVSAMFENLGDKIGPKDEETQSATKVKLVQAGYRRPGAVMKFQGAKGVLAVVLAGLFLLVRYLFFHDMSVAGTSFGAVLAAVVGVYGPDYWLKTQVAKRQEAVANELPDGLDLLVVCVESGMGLDQAIERVSHELRVSGPVISQELKQLTLELRAGKARSDALRGLAERVGLDDLNNLTSLLVQADIFGISVGRTLRVYSDAMRTKRTQRAEEKAAKLPVLLLLPLVLFILPSLFISIMGPAVIQLMGVFEKMP